MIKIKFVLPEHYHIPELLRAVVAGCNIIEPDKSICWSFRLIAGTYAGTHFELITPLDSQLLTEILDAIRLPYRKDGVDFDEESIVGLDVQVVIAYERFGNKIHPRVSKVLPPERS